MKPLSLFSFTCAFALLSAGKPSHAATSPDTSPAIPLAALVDHITTSHPELEFYEAEIAAAKTGRRSAGSLTDPEVALELGRKRVRDASGGFAGDGAAWSVSVTQTFEWPGRLALRKAIANRDAELAELGLERFRRALAARVRTLAYGLHVASAEAAAIREVAGRFAALKEIYVARDPAGVTPLLEMRILEAAGLALQRRATDADLALQAALIELNQLRGADPGAPLRVVVPEITFRDPPDTSALVAAALENNFEFQIRRLELEQHGDRIRLARNERYPSVSISPFYSQEKAGERETVVGLGFSVPLPVSPASRHAPALAEIRQRQAETAVAVARRELQRDVLLAAEAFRARLADARNASPDAVNAFRETAELADRHHRLGAVPIATYVELQNSYLDAIESLLDTQQDALEAGLKLEALTGPDLKLVELAR